MITHILQLKKGTESMQAHVLESDKRHAGQFLNVFHALFGVRPLAC